MKINPTHLIHTVLGHSYMLFVLFFCLAVFSDQMYPLTFHAPILESVGIVLVLFATLIIFWAQRSGHRSAKVRYDETPDARAFMFGPYAYMRTPTQFALFLLVLGLGFAVDMPWISIFAFVAFIISYTFFIKKQEKILIKRYGAAYESYRSQVRF